MKKTLALILAFAMVFSTITVAFAEEEVVEAVAEEVAEEAVEEVVEEVVTVVSDEAKALATIGMLEGTGAGVTAEYTATELNRLTASIMILKLKGLYEEALKYEGENNFVDAEEVVWAEGRNILAYVKDNPVGFGGNEKGEFMPYDTLSEQMLYKVLLENLGYKQVTADVADGDFAWEETLEFAESLGLKPAKAEKFTVDGLSKAVVAALKTNMKDGKAWIEVLVESGKVDKADAIAAELMEEVKAIAVAVDEVKAIGNTVVEIVFEDDVDEAALGNADNYEIDGLEIKEVVVTGSDTVRLETAAMSAGKVYVITVGEEKVKFTGIAKVSGAPSIKTAASEDVEEVVITFDKNIDFETGTDVANYAISGVEIVEAEVDGDEVTLTTVGLVARKQYTVKVTNVKSVDGGLLKAASKSFYTRPDTSAPKVDDVKAETNQRVIVLYNEKVTKDSAENLENYAIKTGTTELAVLEAKLITSGDNKEKEVELTTEVQKANARYEISISNITDKKKAANTITKAVKKTFYGKKEDTTAPTYSGVTVVSRNHIELRLKDNSRFDEASVLDVNNYTLTKSSEDIAVNNAEKVSFKDGIFTVLLTVDDLGVGSYSLKIIDVADEFGNVMKEKKTTVSVKREDLAAATVKKYEVTDIDTIMVYFTKPLNEASAEDISNYKFNNDIGAPSKVTYENDDYSVEIETVEFDQGKTYKLTIDGVEDIAGNVLDLNFKFVAVKGEVDDTAPELADVYAINKYVVAVAFDEEVEFESGAKIVLKNVIDEEDEVTLEAKTTSEDDTVVEFSYYLGKDNVNTEKLVASKEYKVTSITGIADEAGNRFEGLDNYKDFPVYGTDEDPEAIEVLNITQTNAKTFEITMSDDVETIAAGTDVTGKLKENVVNFIAESDKDDETLVYLEKTTVIKESDEYQIDLTEFIKDKHGIPTENIDKEEYTIFYAEYEDDEKPYIVNVVATDRNTVEIEYSEEIHNSYPGTYTIKNADETVSKSSILNTPKVDKDDGKLVVLTLSTPLEGRYDYKLIIGSTPARDLANKTAEEAKGEEFFFNGTDLAPIPKNIGDQKVAEEEAAKYVTSVTVSETVVGAVYVDVAQLKANREVAKDDDGNDIFTVEVVAKKDVDYEYLDLEKVQNDTEVFCKRPVDDAVVEEVVVLEFKKDGIKVVSIEVTVRIEKEQVVEP